MKRIKLFTNNTIKSKKVEKEVIECLEKYHFEIVEEDYEVAIAIGGDGAFLRMVKEADFNNKVLFVGINAGTLGFAQEIGADEIETFVKNLKKENYNYEEIGIEEIEVYAKEGVFKFHALNEIVIRDEELNTTGLDVYVDDVLLEEYVGDGLLITTSFGSTAYNLSFGGSIVYNTFHTLQITPIAPLNNKSYRNLINSVVIPSDKTISLVPSRNQDLMFSVDGDNKFYDQVEKIKISIKNQTIKVIRKKDYNFIQKINDKFLK